MIWPYPAAHCREKNVFKTDDPILTFESYYMNILGLVTGQAKKLSVIYI